MVVKLFRKIRVEPIDSRFVLQSWLGELPWKMQTVLIQGLRAPDTHFCKNVKIVSRWVRSKVLKNAHKDHTFMCRKDELPAVEDLENELEYCTIHFTTHFLYAMEIIAYKHPDKATRRIALKYYEDFVWGVMHFNIEKEKALDIRLEDVDAELEPEACPPEEYDAYLR